MHLPDARANSTYPFRDLITNASAVKAVALFLLLDGTKNPADQLMWKPSSSFINSQPPSRRKNPLIPDALQVLFSHKKAALPSS